MVVHNKYRAIHGSGKLRFVRINAYSQSVHFVVFLFIYFFFLNILSSLDDKANEYAQKFAEELAKLPELIIYHSKCFANGYSENVWRSGYTTVDSTASARDVVRPLYQEIKDYDWVTKITKTKKKPVGHFTALVWKESKLLGVGFARAVNGNVVVVFEYNPSGNMVGSHDANVLPAL